MENLAERNGPKRPTLIETLQRIFKRAWSIKKLQYKKLQYIVSDNTWDNFEAKKTKNRSQKYICRLISLFGIILIRTRVFQNIIYLHVYKTKH